ncbi:glycosyltransferase family 2 protein [Latilactobacillus sakei]|uniref:Glycosyltransferase family 2 protein n=1 Tax=Latilactobacillus sakei TaxID=1599 RepID=A0AAF0K3R4_LATSK|nr:glycosyltransferase family 2 protein [Latilactobacillus sakei]WGI18797.1 glycosyltransferase family 2 protein [Latilactobacillus sakei]
MDNILEKDNRDVCAIVVTYNRKSLLVECLEALGKNKEVKHIVVVNNNSSDGTREYLETLDKEFYIIENSTHNLGGAGGFSLGMELAYKRTNAKYFWIMDDDTIANFNAASELVEKATLLKNNFGFLCSNVRWTDGSSCNIPMAAKNWPELTTEGLVGVTQGTFVSILVSRDTVDKFGIPTKELFIWGDDTEYTVRVTQDNPSYFVKDSIVIHKTPNNLSGITLKNDSLDRVNRYFYLYRNLIFISKTYKGNKDTFKLFTHYMIYALNVLLKSENHKWRRAMVVLKGIFAGIKFNPDIKYMN